MERGLQSKPMSLCKHHLSSNFSAEFGFEEDSPPSSPDGLPTASSAQVPVSVAQSVPASSAIGERSSDLPIVYQHVRNLSCITATLSEPLAVDDTSLPFLGALAMSYLRAHGYDLSSILHIFASYHKSHSADEFTTTLSLKGLPIAEGRFIWDIIVNGLAGGQPTITFV
jgi:hypothetical protein